MEIHFFLILLFAPPPPVAGGDSECITRGVGRNFDEGVQSNQRVQGKNARGCSKKKEYFCPAWPNKILVLGFC